MQATSQPNFKRRLTLVVLLPGTLAAVVLVLLEVGLRAYEHFVLETPSQPAPASSGAVYQVSSVAGRFYELTPNAHIVRDGLSIKINSMGMRDHEPPLYEAIKGKKVLVLGDSVAWGFGVPMDEAFPQRLESALEVEASSRDEARPVVYNAAVNGYSLRQEIATLYDIGFHLKPDLIVVAYVLNDPATEQDGGLVRFFRKELLLRRYVRVGRERMKELALGAGVPEEFHQRIHFVHKEEVRSDLAGLKNVADAIGAKVILLVCPIFKFKANEPYPWRNIDMDLKAFSTEHGIEFVDVWPQFEGFDSSEVEFDYLHPNSRGHKLIADALINATTQVLYPSAP